MRGTVASIHIAPTASAPMQGVEFVRAVPDRGLEGDRYASSSGTFSATEGGGRHVTLIESEAVDALNAKLGTQFGAGEMRRNIVTRGIALNHLVGREFSVGEVRLVGIRLCEPCEHLESLTAKGLISTMLHRCGLRTEIVTGGTIRVADPIVIPDASEERNKMLIRRYYDEMWNAWNFEAANDLLSPEIVFRGSLGAETRGLAAFCDYMWQVRRAFPDFHNVIDEVIAEDDRVVARLKYSGTHEGELFGIAPTHRKIAYAGTAFFRIAAGRIAEGWVLGDIFALLKSLGARALP